jgi:hypothetical protein
MSKQAERVITKCGAGDLTKGLSLVAEWTGVDRSRLYRWMQPKTKGGTGGLIPAQHHQRIMNCARHFSVALDPADFFDGDGEGLDHIQAAS